MPRSPPPRDRSRSPRRDSRPSGGGYRNRRPSPPDLQARPRDNGYGSRGAYDGSSVKKEYTERDRERERADERKKYDDNGDQDPDRPPSVEPEKPNFSNSGLLAKAANTVKGVQLKYNEPPEARKPLKNWRLYVFKGKEQVDLVHIYKQSAFLIGRDTVVTDIPISHPSCSKQHAVIQFRQVSEKSEFGDVKSSVKPFIIDLDSTNGTHVNGQEIPKSRYYELRVNDVIKFGTSSREYVLLHEEA